MGGGGGGPAGLPPVRGEPRKCSMVAAAGTQRHRFTASELGLVAEDGQKARAGAGDGGGGKWRSLQACRHGCG